jgi:hypothetical protein
VSTSGALQRIGDSLEYLSQIVAAQSRTPQPDFDRLLMAYVEARRNLAKNFRELANSVLVQATERLEGVRTDVKAKMRADFGGLVPERFLEVQSYGKLHAVLLEYLSAHQGEPVAASRLRVLAGDQVHTERRVRELRDLGLAITWKRGPGEVQYVLESDRPDLGRAARSQLALGLRADRKLKREDRASLMELTTPQDT